MDSFFMVLAIVFLVLICGGFIAACYLAFDFFLSVEDDPWQ